jgi:SAM-dependent methyltransferase
VAPAACADPALGRGVCSAASVKVRSMKENTTVIRSTPKELTPRPLIEVRGIIVSISFECVPWQSQRTACWTQIVLVSDFYDYPDLYDALLPVGAEVPFYVDLARQQAGAVLELACGTGQLTIPIALDGRPTVGLDQSSAMLTVAKRRASATGASVAFVQSDMRDFALGSDFSLIFIARNSLLHLLSTVDLLAAFTAVRRHLAPDGIFAFDIFNPNVRMLARPLGQRFPVMEVNTATFGPLCVEGTHDYDSATQVSRGTWYISTPERRDAWVVPMVLRSIFPQELPLLLSAAGLELISRFGELSRAAFGPGSRVQVCLCRRRL